MIEFKRLVSLTGDTAHCTTVASTDFTALSEKAFDENSKRGGGCRETTDAGTATLEPSARHGGSAPPKLNTLFCAAAEVEMRAAVMTIPFPQKEEIPLGVVVVKMDVANVNG